MMDGVNGLKFDTESEVIVALPTIIQTICDLNTSWDSTKQIRITGTFSDVGAFFHQHGFSTVLGFPPPVNGHPRSKPLAGSITPST